MNHDEPQGDEPNFVTPPDDFEIVELDTTAHLTDEQRSRPVGEFVQTEDFAIEVVILIPALVLTVEVPTAGAAAEAASDCEAGFGGSGLDQRGCHTRNGTATLTLVPRTLEGARERLTRVARIAAGFAGTKAAAVV